MSSLWIALLRQLRVSSFLECSLSVLAPCSWNNWGNCAVLVCSTGAHTATERGEVTSVPCSSSLLNDEISVLAVIFLLYPILSLTVYIKLPVPSLYLHFFWHLSMPQITFIRLDHGLGNAIQHPEIGYFAILIYWQPLAE